MRGIFFMAVLLVGFSALAVTEMPILSIVKYEDGVTTMRTADVIRKSTNDENDLYVINSYKKSLMGQGYKAVSCTQVDGYGLSYAVQCVVLR